MRRPFIGITPDFSEGTAGSPAPRYEVKVAYAEAVAKAGGIPLVIPYTDDARLLLDTLERFSAVVVTGGAFDIPPEAYGEKPKEGLGQLKVSRTRFETHLLRAALDRRMAVLGVCGGMQLLNVVRGGALIQDIGREVKSPLTHEQSHDRTQPQHPVEVAPGSRLATCVGKGQLMVNSTHHQAVSRLGAGLRPSAVAPDGVVEAIELEGDAFAVGVQWHPELLIETVPAHLGIYRELVRCAQKN
ncbi:MAG: gamma-glutamyl-gamma-aminobutyrate hydrolase family protein [Myxococcaceae bacterium]